jgi:hypothetical protein
MKNVIFRIPGLFLLAIKILPYAYYFRPISPEEYLNSGSYQLDPYLLGLIDTEGTLYRDITLKFPTIKVNNKYYYVESIS